MNNKMKMYSLLLFLLMLSGCVYSPADVCLIPQAESIVMGKGALSIQRLKSIGFPTEWRNAGDAFVADLKELTGLSMQVVASNPSIHVQKVEMQEPEMYRLEISKQGICIEAGDLAGMVHGFATFLQLILGSDGKELPLLTLHDKPRFGYRGVMIDCSRHFWTVAELRKQIRLLSFFKLNTLHLHLTDNQGWRLYLDKYPDLAPKGTHYKEMPELSGTYYRKDELKDLVAYAARYGVEIVPEVDLPGHSLALLAGLPQLSCIGGEFETYAEEQKEPKKRMGENMLCIGNPETYKFVENVVEELTEIFPSPYIHLGGDEVATHVWQQCPKCQKLYKQYKMTSWNELQDFFTQKVSQIVRTQGKRMIGWDEINNRNATDPADIVMAWQGDGMEQQQKALARGLSVIMAPKDPCYVDFGYSRNSTRRVYEWEPVGEVCTEAQAHLIKGGQVCLWTEFVTTVDEVERMLYPRTCALAENLWNTKEKKDWDSFSQRLGRFDAVFEKLNVAYFKDKYLDNPGFCPQVDEMPPLVSPARMETSMVGCKYFLPEYTFDGDLQTMFSTSFIMRQGDHFTLHLEKAQAVREMMVIFDAAKEHPKHVQLSVSEEGKTFKTIDGDYKNGEWSASFETPVPVQTLKIAFTDITYARLTIKEIILR